MRINPITSEQSSKLNKVQTHMSTPLKAINFKGGDDYDSFQRGNDGNVKLRGDVQKSFFKTKIFADLGDDEVFMMLKGHHIKGNVGEDNFDIEGKRNSFNAVMHEYMGSIGDKDLIMIENGGVLSYEGRLGDKRFKMYCDEDKREGHSVYKGEFNNKPLEIEYNKVGHKMTNISGTIEDKDFNFLLTKHSIKGFNNDDNKLLPLLILLSKDLTTRIDDYQNYAELDQPHIS